MEMDFVPILGFPTGRWRLDLLGDVRKNIHQSDDYEVEAQFSRITNQHVPIFSEDTTRVASTGERSKIVNFWLSAGFIPVLQSGSQWQNGSPIVFSPHDWGYKQTVNLKYPLNPRLSKRMRARDIISDNYLLGNMFPNVWCRVFSYGKRHIVIPSWELIRFYYCSSSKVANLIISGRLSKDILIHENKTYLREDGIFQLCLRKDFNDTDAPVILRLTQSTEAYQQALYIHKSLRASVSQGEALVDADFPFKSLTSPKLYGCWLPTDGHKEGAFWVMRIASCDHPFPYERLGVERDNPGGVSVLPREGAANAEASVRGTKIVAEPTTLQPMGGGKHGLKTVKIVLPEKNGFSFFDNREIVYLYREHRVVTEGGSCGSTMLSDNPLAVGTVSTESNIRPASLVRSQDEEAAENEFDETRVAAAIEPWFEELLESLGKLESRGVFWVVRNPSTGVRGRQVLKTLFPIQSDSSRLQWMFLDSQKKRRRAGMWVQIKLGTQYFYLFELERREDESYGLYVLARAQGNSWVADAELVQLMTRWGRGRSQQTEQQNRENGWLRRSIHHTVNQSLDDLAARIFRILTEMK
ncbi:hypothetical protein FK216_06125 [Moraxellaceae bacterium AER2_44_116]|nr:hypothetical protein [Moraxellaceae bacterium]TQC98432.1 hypothetical protein FK216_06125 [Moraxellaceae bacterium AER2_44_116]